MEERLRHLSDWNYETSMTWQFGTSETGEVVNRRDALIVSCGLPVDEHNWTFPRGPLRDVDAMVEYAVSYFEARRLGHCFQVRDGLEKELAPRLDAAGFRIGESTPVMVMAPIREQPGSLPELEIRRVATVQDLGRFRETAFDGFGLPVPAAKLFLTEDMFALPTVRFYLGCMDGEPACSVALVATGEVAGIYWVATREGFRGRGFGTAMTWAAIRGGLELGCRIASLQASKSGRPLYEAMGFAHTGSYRRFGPRPSERSR